VPRRTLGPAGTAGQLLGARDVGVACVRRQWLRPPARWPLAPADMDLPHRRSFRPVPGLQVRTCVSSLGLRMKAGRMSAHRSRGAGRRRPRRPAQTGKTSGHRQVGRLVRRDAPAIGKQRAGVLKHHDAVAEQAPALFGMRRHHVGRPAIRCVRGRTPTLMLAHDAPRSCCRRQRPCLRRRSCVPIRDRWRPCRLAGGRTELTRGRNPAGGGLSPHCFAHTLLVPAAVVMLRPAGIADESAAGWNRQQAARPPAPRRSSRGRAPPAAPATGPGDNPRSASGHDDPGTARGIPHGKSAFGWVRTRPSTSRDAVGTQGPGAGHHAA